MSIEYAANGQKIRQNSSEELQYYSSGAEYKNGKIDAIHLSEGRLSYTDGTARLEYVIRDHLGNTRITFTDLNGDGVIDAKVSGGELLQENHYYPFGLGMNNPDYATSADPENRYQYNGKENVSELGIGMLDYGARWYDPAIGRFTGVDPIAEDFAHVSVYNYAGNEPIANIDLWGLQKVSIHILGSIILNQTEGSFKGDVAMRSTIDIGNGNKTTTEFFAPGSDGYNEVKQEVDLPSGIKIPKALAKFGLEEARKSVTPKTIEEAEGLSQEEETVNETVRFVLNSIEDLIESGDLQGVYDYDGSIISGGDSEGETEDRKMTNVYKGKLSDFQFSEGGIMFKGQIIISYTQEKEVENDR